MRVFKPRLPFLSFAVASFLKGFEWRAPIVAVFLGGVVTPIGPGSLEFRGGTLLILIRVVVAGFIAHGGL